MNFLVNLRGWMGMLDMLNIVCDVCAKKPTFGHNVPWSKKKTNRRWSPNIQSVRAFVNGGTKRMNVCTGCLKAGKIARAKI